MRSGRQVYVIPQADLVGLSPSSSPAVEHDADPVAASADRRPVDPPPIVDLRVFEVNGEEKRDITFPHQANFFLYSTLEHARQMNQGRVPMNAATLPVLTGTPVAGMAYLDRPKPAGYFIFPDLSVRHEGRYRLSFNLYEELKNPEKDDDPDAPVLTGSLDSTKIPPRQHVHFRLEVKSNPFNVFSAKKFPGLAESTSLSRIVNEQGCRVRIRRDVRMRRRDKMSDNYHNTEDAAMSGPRYSGPPSSLDRPRSPSNVGSDVTAPYSSNADKRYPFQDINYYPSTTYQQPQPPAPQPATPYSHLSFGGPATAHYQTPPAMPLSHPQTNQNYIPQASPYSYQPQHHHRQMSNPHTYGYAGSLTHPSPVASPGYIDERAYPDSRRSSGGYSAPRAPGSMDTYDPARSYNQQNMGLSQARSLTPINTNSVGQGPPSLPPIKALVHQSPLEPRSSEPKTSNASIEPHGPHNPFSSAGYATPSHQNTTTATIQPSTSHPPSQSKRSYGDVFDATHMNQPLHSGMRPAVALQSQDLPHIETADGEYTDPYSAYEDIAPLIYKRADGSRRAKKCPSPRDK